MCLAGAKKIKNQTPILKDISFLECRSHTESHGLIGTESHAESPRVTELRAVQSHRVTELRAMHSHIVSQELVFPFCVQLCGIQRQMFFVRWCKADVSFL